MQLTCRTFSYTSEGIKPIWATPEIPDKVFDQLMEWAVTNIQGLIDAKKNPGVDTKLSIAAYDSWNELWRELQRYYPDGAAEFESILGFFRIVRDNPEILVWLINKSSLPSA